MERKVWTAAELDAMPTADADALFTAHIVDNIDDVPAPFLEGLRADVQARIEANEASRR